MDKLPEDHVPLEERDGGWGPRREGCKPWPPPRLTHTKRCQAKSRSREDGRCGNWSSKGSIFCRYHGGTRKGGVNGLYARRAKNKLKEIFEQVDDATDQRSSLRAEVDAARAMAAHSMALFNAALDADNLTGAAAAGEHAAKALDLVSRLVMQMTKVDMVDPRTLDAEQIEGLLRQVGTILEKHLTPAQIEPILADFQNLKVDRAEDGRKVVVNL